MYEAITEAVKSFPDGDYVDKVCKLGQTGQCRYVAPSSDSWCARYTTIQSILDARRSNLPVNCAGAVVKVMEFRDELIGQKVVYEDPGLYQQEGLLKDLQLEDDNMSFDIDWRDEKPLGPFAGYHRVNITSTGISFSPVMGIPAEMTERLTIVLREEPAKTPELTPEAPVSMPLLRRIISWIPGFPQP